MRELRSLFSHLTQLYLQRFAGLDDSREKYSDLDGPEHSFPLQRIADLRVYRSGRAQQRGLVTGQIDNKRAKLYLGRAARQY